MMILTWLGSFFVILVGLEMIRRGTNGLLVKLEKIFLNLNEPKASVFTLLATAKFAAYAQASALRAKIAGLALLNSRAFSKRRSLLLLCVANAGHWVVLLLMLLAWQLDGGYVLGLVFIAMLFIRRDSAFAIFGIGWGLALLGLEWAMRKQSIVMTMLGESDLHFLLADGRFSAQGILFVLAFVLTWILRCESWSVFLSLLLLAAGSLSLNGAVAITIGELFAWGIILLFNVRKLNQEVKDLTKQYVIASTVGLLIGFFGAGYLREIFSWGYSFEVSQLTEKSLQFAAMFFVVIFCQALVVMVWGHFAAKKPLDELQSGEYFPASWVQRNWLSPGFYEFIKGKLQMRLKSLLQQNQNVSEAEKQKIPGAFLKSHQEEIARLIRFQD